MRHCVLSVLLSAFSSVTLALLDGGDFGRVEAVHSLSEGNSGGVCIALNWKELFIPNEDSCFPEESEVAKHTVESLSVLESSAFPQQVNGAVDGQIVQENEVDETEPLPINIHPLGLNVAPLKPPDITSSEEVSETNARKSQIDDDSSIRREIGNLNSTVSSSNKPYIVKAIPKDVLSDAIEKHEKETEVKLSEKSDHEVLEKESNESFLPSEGAVDEESLDDTPILKPEDGIASFSQWAEKKLEEEALLKDNLKKELEPEIESKSGSKHITQGPVTQKIKSNGVKLSKNFAGPDCSAKIVGANSESQGAGNVITSSRDEYFLNKCTDQAWFVIELCESIKALKIQIANFELYSSSPNQFKVSIGSVFPGRDKDWFEFGTFFYQDERNIQTFKNEYGVVGKYVKVEILSHHGSEHYCPVSMFKVYGISEIDLITEDEPADGHDDASEDTVDDELREHIIVKTIKEAVHKVVNVFRPQNVSLVATLNTSSLQGASLRYRLRPENGHGEGEQAVDRYHMIYYLLATQYQSVKRYSQIMRLDKLLLYSCESYGVSLLEPLLNANTSSSVCSASALPWQFAKFVRVVHGEDFLVALCNVMSMEQGMSILVHGRKLEGNMSNITDVSDDNNSTIKGSEVINQTMVKYDIEKHESINNDNKIVEEKDPETTNTPNKNGNVDVASQPKLEASSSSQQASDPQPTKAAPSAASASSSQASQTTWQKLANKIKALERNVTLSTGFLEELSVKYIKQIDEINNAVKIANDAIIGAVDREELAKEKFNVLERKVNHLDQQMNRLIERVDELQEEVLARHGLMILLEVLIIGMVFLLCRPGSSRELQQTLTMDRRRSLDTMIGDKVKCETEKRRNSIEVGSLANGHLGSMVEPALSKRQRKRKRRKESRQGLRNVLEESNSDDSKTSHIVYDTFHGSGRDKEQVNRKRNRSWSEQSRDEHLTEQINRFTVDQVEDDSNMLSPKQQLSPSKLMERSTVNPSYVTSFPCSHNNQANLNSKDNCKSILNTSRRRKGSTIQFTNGHSMSMQEPMVKVSNMYTMLDHSVHETSACETEPEIWRVSNSKGVSGSRSVVNGKPKSGRSKSSSPNRQANLLMRRQREAIRQFQPQQVEWLQKRDS